MYIHPLNMLTFTLYSLHTRLSRMLKVLHLSKYKSVYISPIIGATGLESWYQPIESKHSDECNYLPPYKLDVLKIVEYRFSCEMEDL